MLVCSKVSSVKLSLQLLAFPVNFTAKQGLPYGLECDPWLMVSAHYTVMHCIRLITCPHSGAICACNQGTAVPFSVFLHYFNTDVLPSLMTGLLVALQYLNVLSFQIK